MPEIDRDALVPEGRRHVGNHVPVVARGVVDQHGDGAEPSGDLTDGGLIGGDVAHIAFDEQRGGIAGSRELLDQGLRGGFIDVDEAYPGTLLGEVLDDRGTDTGTAAR